MTKGPLYALIIIGLVLVLLGGVYWYTSRDPKVGSAELYEDSGFSLFDQRSAPKATPTTVPAAASVGTTNLAAPIPGPTPTPTVAPEDTVANPPLSQSTSIQDIEADLNNTVIEEEIFSDL